MKTGKKCWTALSVITSTLLVIVLALTSTAYSYEALINRTLGELPGGGQRQRKRKYAVLYGKVH